MDQLGCACVLQAAQSKLHMHIPAAELCIPSSLWGHGKLGMRSPATGLHVSSSLWSRGRGQQGFYLQPGLGELRTWVEDPSFTAHL